MKKLIVAGVICAGLCAGNASATTWDAAADFSSTTNPNGVWAYGTTGTSMSSNFSAFSNVSDYNGFTHWNNGGNWFSSTFPYLGKNTGADFASSTVTIPTQTLDAHPSNNGDYAVLMFTAPNAGTYQMSANFWGNDVAGTTTDVQVYAPSLGYFFSGNVTGHNIPVLSWSDTQYLAAGQQVLFGIGYGNNQSYYNDSTGFSVIISDVITSGGTSNVPEPAPILLLSLGLLGLGAARRRG